MFVPVAIKAYERVIKLAPDSAEAQQARQQVQVLRLQAKAAQPWLVRLLETWRGL